jgi:hypothetical protein
VQVLVQQRQGRAGAGGLGHQRGRGRHHATSTWAPNAATETPNCACCWSVRDRVHLADVLRTLRRCPVVLRVARVKP